MKFIDEMIELSESYVNSDIEWLKRHMREAAQEGRRETTVFFENDKIKVAEKWCEDQGFNTISVAKYFHTAFTVSW